MGPMAQVPSGYGLVGMDYGGFAGAAFGGIVAVDGALSAGLNTNGHGGYGLAGAFGTVVGGSPIGGSYGFPSDSGLGLGLAASFGPAFFYSSAEQFRSTTIRLLSRFL